jgi:hypothetical protein
MHQLMEKSKTIETRGRGGGGWTGSLPRLVVPDQV